MDYTDLENEASQTVVKFLEANVPRSDIVNIRTELKKDFLLGKTKSRDRKLKLRKRRTRLLTRKEKKNLGFYLIPRGSIKYIDIEPLHKIWVDYVSQILELDKYVPDVTSKQWEQFTQTLYKADFNGSMLEVVRSKCPSYVGKKGICIMDTKNTFKIVSINDLVTTIPKKESIFNVYIKNLKLIVFGKHFCIRPAERSSKKFKTILHPDL
ncbi:ribonuclease P protein subunit p29 [Pieris rapae]|uniref:ribonuclease P protein subunit p29 n=1 Tax=Pieris rapae TaxID=64459 RepID=UPI000B92638A|nr:ribonuclease P protein subunit p29 [Pieris rapae]